nr:hypothetical protein [Tanacetum cinerariifolium]
MEEGGEKNKPLRSAFAAKIRNIDGKIIGKDGKPMRTAESEPVKLTRWEDGQDNRIRTFAKVENSDFVLPMADVIAVKNKFENTLVMRDEDGVYFLNFDSIHGVEQNVTFPLVKNYVSNTWNKYGFQKVMRDEDGVYFLNFDSIHGVEQVLQQGLWMIRNTPIILNKWTPNLSLSKDEILYCVDDGDFVENYDNL